MGKHKINYARLPTPNEISLLSINILLSTSILIGNFTIISRHLLPFKCFPLWFSPWFVHRYTLFSLYRCRTVQVLVYYGLSLSSTQFGVNKYISFSISGFIEIPANIVPILVVDRMGRKLSLISSMMLSGSACLSTLFIRKSTQAIYSRAGKVG